jgi:hypothetical protein
LATRARAFIARVAKDVREGHVSAEIYSLGENGDIPLALSGQLWDKTTRHGLDENAYNALVKAVEPKWDQRFGLVTAVVASADLDALASRLERDQALYRELRGERVRRYLGYKMLAFPALVGMLAHELGVKTIVLVPQEMSDGLIVDRLVPRSR